jgi:catechol 2,3-dioxygenase-like lactoylglutathione lyase family enzyme
MPATRDGTVKGCKSGVGDKLEMSYSSEFPPKGAELGHVLVVSDVAKSRDFYQEVLGASLVKEYGQNSCVLSLCGSWVLLVRVGDATDRHPHLTFTPPSDSSIVSHELTIRVPDCRAAYESLRSRGVDLLGPPVPGWQGETRCFLRDPDGHLIEISEHVGLPVPWAESKRGRKSQRSPPRPRSS